MENVVLIVEIDKEIAEITQDIATPMGTSVSIRPAHRSTIDPVIVTTILVPILSSLAAGIGKAIGEDIWDYLKNIIKKLDKPKHSMEKYPRIEVNIADINTDRKVIIKLNSRTISHPDLEIEAIKERVPELILAMNQHSLSVLTIDNSRDELERWKVGIGVQQNGSKLTIKF